MNKEIKKTKDFEAGVKVGKEVMWHYVFDDISRVLKPIAEKNMDNAKWVASLEVELFKVAERHNVNIDKG